MKAIKLSRLFLLGSIIVTVALCSCEVEDVTLPDMGEFKDSRDGRIYEWVKIGDQVWMADNLSYTGSDIKHIPDNDEWNNNNYDGWCYLSNNSNYSDTYGVLYQWEAAKIACPDGWHLPSVEEWRELEDYLITHGYSYDGVQNKNIAKSLATDSGWFESTNEGAIGNSDYPEYRNKTGFSALSGGSRLGYHGTWNGIFGGYWWSSTDYDISLAYLFNLSYDNSELIGRGESKNDGFSVRCVKD